MSPPRQPLKPRLLANIDKVGDCWIWRGSKTKDGYGVLTIGRKQFRAHRVAFEVFKGKTPSGALVCHSCDIPLCINPAHLFKGTPKDNTGDMIKKGRRVTVEGAAHPLIKILPEQRAGVRRLRQEGKTLTAIAKAYGVSFQTISSICRGVGSYGSR